MFSEVSWALLIAIFIILIWQLAQAISEDFAEHKRIKDLSNGQESFGDPGSDQWIKAFEEKYGRKPEGNKTSNMAKNIVGGFVKGTVLGTITGGFTGAIQNSLIYGIASPTISTFAESFIDDKPILKV
jgi:hypothetical protein